MQRRSRVVPQQGHERGRQRLAGLLSAHLAQTLHQRECVERVGGPSVLVARARVLPQDGQPAQPDDDAASLEAARSGEDPSNQHVAPRRRRAAPAHLSEEHDELHGLLGGEPSVRIQGLRRRKYKRDLHLGLLGLGLPFPLILPLGLLRRGCLGPRRREGPSRGRRLENREERAHRSLGEHRAVPLFRVQLRHLLVGPQRPAHQLHHVHPALSRRRRGRLAKRKRRSLTRRAALRRRRGRGRSRGPAPRAPAPPRRRGPATCAGGGGNRRSRLRRRAFLLLARPRRFHGRIHVRREELREALHDPPVVPSAEHLAAFLKGEEVRAELLEFGLERRVGGVGVAEHARELRGGVHLRRVTGQVLRSRALRWVGTGDRVRLWVVQEGCKLFEIPARVSSRGETARRRRCDGFSAAFGRRVRETDSPVCI